MKAVSEGLYQRGKRRIYQVRKRIPADLRASYPRSKECISRSLRTSDQVLAKSRMHAALAEIEAEFHAKRSAQDLSGVFRSPRPVRTLSDAELHSVAQFWLQQTLATDENGRAQGLTDTEFDELGQALTGLRAQLGRCLARGDSLKVLPVLTTFLRLCGLEFRPQDDHETKRACFAFLKTIVTGLDEQLARQAGQIIAQPATEARHPLQVLYPAPVEPEAEAGPGWDRMFETWRDVVVDRPKSTTIASQTAWHGLRDFAASAGIGAPTAVTPELMAEWVESLAKRGLAVKTINERILKVRAIYKWCRKRPHLGVMVNPALETAGFKESNVKKRRKRRLPFDKSELCRIFGSEIYTQHKRSKGQSGEATYWIPLLMFYSGGRPEEFAGLPLSDIKLDPETNWWYFDLKDTGLDDGDVDLFEEANSEGEAAEVPDGHSRTLKNAASVRKVPVARELIELGLLRYMDWLRSRGETMLFPTLKKDFHGKLSGAFSKFFGRFKRSIGIKDDRKVLYSFRHSMKDLLEAARCPSKYLQRLLGHTTGDGAVTDGYGSDLPFPILIEFFEKVQFPAIPALPWEPGRGFVTLKLADEVEA